MNITVKKEIRPLDSFLYEIVKNRPGKILDYGCGAGEFLSFCSERELKIRGVDTYQGIWESWNEDKENIYLIKGNVTPFPDSEFQTIVSNMVFEHIPPQQILDVTKEITRILAVNGNGFSIFPTKKTFIEGHIGVPLVHLLKNQTNIQRIYLHICFLLGLGYWRSEKKRGFKTTINRTQWVNRNIELLENETFYNAISSWKKHFKNFGCTVENISYLLAIFALPKPLQLTLSKLCKIHSVKRAVNLLVEIRLGVILKVTKPG